MKNQEKLPIEKISKIDQISRHAADVFDTIKPDINHQRIWETIFEKLNHLDKKILGWFFAVATSISLLTASAIEFYQFNLPKESPVALAQVAVEEIEKMEVIPSIDQPAIKALEIQEISRRDVESLISKKPSEKIEILKIESVRTEYKTQKNDLVALKKWNAYVGVNLQNTSFAPEIGISFDVFKLSKKEKTHKINLGISTRLVKMTANETNNTKIQPYTYANIQYSHTNDIKHSTWSVKAGYLLNPDNHFMKHTTIKFNALKSITPHILIGPEVIFTDGFKKAYPGLSLVFNT